ncbi:FMN-dependent NADH-azoreductase [Noviherbaspirillum sp. UKPF54]|uniref:FMN-dependent NADH-azoreductase n=1 Tax=Noviherbaspirillum sp. UKPF54 TaxID=2601898 RepID=UPI0011B0FA4B|nr:NAD(P)H-dependent oxidoreductase [Noviherbaspirillum sp. UKPF54]QDZ27959.1 FMN-dependent NADH-azoreductase [Noviherbaspirillum sp. UKPF54]
MTTLLQINASLFSNNGQSSRLSDQFVAAWREANPQGTVVTRDLAAAPVPHLDAQRFGAFLAKPEERTAQQQAVVDFSDTLIEELRQADVIALGLPMYNFGVPSTLKAYFDHVARAGVTFRYTETGPVGLLTGKKVYVFATRGGLYAGSALDTQTGYVRDFLRFIGITDVEFVYAEGLNMGEESKQSALNAASASIRQLAEPMRAAA